MPAHQSIIQELEDAMSEGSAVRRNATLRRITDLFVSGALHYSSEQIALFDDVLGRLMAEIETAARAELAGRLAPIANAPPAVVTRLAFDRDIAVAGPVLAQSPRLQDATVLEISRTAGLPHLLAISQRPALSEAVTDVLVARGDEGVVRNIAGNRGARFSAPGYAALVKWSERSDAIAIQVGARADLPRHLFLQLLAKASEAVRQNLERADVQGAHDIKQVVAAVASRMSAVTVGASWDYRQSLERINALHSQGRLDDACVDELAGAKKFEDVAVALSVLCDVPVDVAERAMMLERTEMLLILAKAAGLSWRTVKAVLDLRPSGHALSLRERDQCLANFQRLKQSTARQAIRLPRFGGKPELA